MTNKLISPSAKTVLDLLPTLQPHELVTIANRIKSLTQFVPSGDNAPTLEQSAREIDGDAGVVIQTIAAVLMSMGVEFVSVDNLRKDTGYKTFREKVPDLMTYIRRAAHTRNEQRALLRMGISLLYDNMTKAGFPVSARTIRNNIHRLPSIFNMTFPGYARAGLLSMLLKNDHPPKEKAVYKDGGFVVQSAE